MILEHALLPVSVERAEAFEEAFTEAQAIIVAMPGFRSLRLLRGIESPHLHLLLVEWDTVEDHEIGFRMSDGYQRWRALLHPFYDPFPVVEHFAPRLAAEALT